MTEMVLRCKGVTVPHATAMCAATQGLRRCYSYSSKRRCEWVLDLVLFEQISEVAKYAAHLRVISSKGAYSKSSAVLRGNRRNNGNFKRDTVMC